MNTVKKYRYVLDPGSKKYECPGCKQKTYVCYKDSISGDYLPKHVGRCDRRDKCAHDYTAIQYCIDNGEGMALIENTEPLFTTEIIDYMPMWYIEKSMQYYKHSNFATWLYSLFGSYTADKALIKYCVGRSKIKTGTGNIFWQIDIEGKVRTGKIMQYDSVTGKKDKSFNWVHNSIKNFHYKQCFFGEYLIAENPNKTIAIFESEKTAIVASIFMPEMVCIATGASLGGCKWREYSVHKVLKDRNVILFPDYGYANKEKRWTCFQEWSARAESIMERMHCKIKVSRVLEDKLCDVDRNDQDLADILIQQDNGKGLAMFDPGYPAAFDLIKLTHEERINLYTNYNKI